MTVPCEPSASRFPPISTARVVLLPTAPSRDCCPYRSAPPGRVFRSSFPLITYRATRPDPLPVTPRVVSRITPRAPERAVLCLRGTHCLPRQCTTRGVHKPGRHTVELIHTGLVRKRTGLARKTWFSDDPSRRLVFGSTEITIKGRKHHGFAEWIKALVDGRDWIRVTHGQRVQPSIIGHKWRLPSALGMSTTGETHSDLDREMTPLANIPSIEECYVSQARGPG